MWVERRRTKKLIVAFHFVRTDQARWKCDACRQQGLDVKRRCGFLAEELRGASRLVWVKGRAGVQECPKSFVTAASVELVEQFFVWKASGAGGWGELTARQADAFEALEVEWRGANGND